jgi:hypothetical protein
MPKHSKEPRSDRSVRFNTHELAFQPWFLPRASRLAINSLIPPSYRNKKRAYFDDYGCMVCGKFDQYDSNGMCLPCHHLVTRRLKTCVRRRSIGLQGETIDLVIQRRKALASKLLGRFANPWSKMPLRYRKNVVSSRNPVDEAIGFLTPGGRAGLAPVVQDQPSADGVLGKSVKDMKPGRRKLS